MMRFLLAGTLISVVVLSTETYFEDGTLPGRAWEGTMVDASWVDVAVKIQMSSLGGPGIELLDGLAMGKTIALETFVTQFILDMSSATEVAAERLFVLNVTDGDVHHSWRWGSTIVKFRALNGTTGPTIDDAVKDLTR